MTSQLLNKISKALSDSTRYRILKTIISKEEISCGEVEQQFTLSQPTISHHLKILWESELITVRKEGQKSFFSPNNKVIMDYLRSLKRELS